MRTTSTSHTSQSHLWIASVLGADAPSHDVTGVLQKRPLFSNGLPMIDVRIVCTHDAVKLAETLMRLLAAEDHQVRLSYGRHSLEDLNDAAESDAVLLVWSLDAPSAHYMLQWASRIQPDRLIEIARAPNWPRIEGRRAPVIDFSSWRGERGGRAWNALVERLRVVQRTLEPKGPPPRRAAMALGLVSAVAVGGAFIERVHDAFDLTPAPPPNESVIATAPEAAAPREGMGGPLQTIEPASIEDAALRVRSVGPRAQHLQLPADLVLNDANAIPDITIEHERSLLQRIGSVALSLRDAALGDGAAQDGSHQEASNQ